MSHYGCCTFNGTVVAVDVATGKVKWTQSVIGRKAAPHAPQQGRNADVRAAGAAIWSA